jgi:Predicted nucleotide-binding protein containing TIR-like domain
MYRPLRVFIASASEGLDVAHAVRNALRNNELFQPIVWNEGSFKPSMTFIEALEAELSRCDFAILTLTGDDQLVSRGRQSMAPRDNVLFELGLFMGTLGRERTYFVCDREQYLKIPTDLLGVNPASYARQAGQDLSEALTLACASIAERMKELDGRPKRTPEVEIENRLASAFCVRIAGTWWGRQQSQGETRLALVRITLDAGTTSLQVNGRTFDDRGRPFGDWKSVAIGLQPKDRKLLFSWEGVHPSAPAESFKGFGQYTFEEAPGNYEQGDGLFADIHMGRKKAPRWTSVEFRRVDIEELNHTEQVMKDGSDIERASQVVKALARFTGSGTQRSVQ